MYQIDIVKKSYNRKFKTWNNVDKPLFEELLESIEVITPMFVIGLGLLVGIQHALVDHITAMSTQMLKSKHRKKQFR